MILESCHTRTILSDGSDHGLRGEVLALRELLVGFEIEHLGLLHEVREVVASAHALIVALCCEGDADPRLVTVMYKSNDVG